MLFNSESSHTWKAFGLKHLHLKELEILRKIMFCPKYDKICLANFCFSGQNMARNLHICLLKYN